MRCDVVVLVVVIVVLVVVTVAFVRKVARRIVSSLMCTRRIPARGDVLIVVLVGMVPES